ncbi:MAG TPA: hypothetical protein VGF44_03105 [Terriglobales bacterium]|jgi:hypothetical protein
MINSNEERSRLAKLYTSLSDGELQKLASDADSLTEEAWDVLEEELDRRDLVDDAEETLRNGAASSLQFEKLMTIREFRDLPEALLAQGCLQSAGIECSLGDANLVRLDWFISNFVGGVKLRVNPKDAREALEILNQPIPAGFHVEGVGIYEQPRCPKCGSLDVAFESLNKLATYTTVMLNVPIPVHNEGWNCHSCKHEWQDQDEDENEDLSENQPPTAQ